jgi:hypothetical protein
MSDFKLHNDGSVVGFIPLTEAAHDFIRDNVHVEDWQWMGPGFFVDHRFAAPLIDGNQEHGLAVANA